MPTITLKAKLQAYSRAPFYGDYVRQPAGILGSEYNKDVTYVLKDGSWIDLAKAVSDTGLSLDELTAKIEEVERNLLEDVRTISCYIDYNRQAIVFIDSNNQEYFYTLPSAATDNISIGLNDNSKITLLDKPDQKSIKVVDVEYSYDNILGIDKKISGKLRADALYSNTDPAIGLSPEDLAIYRSEYISGYDIKNRLSKAEKNIKDIESYIQGTGGFLDPYNFGQSLTNIDELSRNQYLNNYAYSQLFNGEAQQLPDQTKVKNVYTGNIWVYIQETNTWINEGQDTIVTATNDGVLGAVTGVEYDRNNPDTKFKISIGKNENGFSNGLMEVNGLQEEFNKVIYRTETDANAATANTYVQRTETGTIIANPAIIDNEVITQGQLNDWISSVIITDTEINDIVDKYFKPVQNNGGLN